MSSLFVCPPAVVGRQQLTTEFPWIVVWHDSPEPLTDANVWLIGFTVGALPHFHGMLSAVEFGGGPIARHFVLLRNSDGAVITEGLYPSNAPGFGFVAKKMGRLDSRIVLTTGERYTFAMWNWDAAQSSAMRAELYL